MEESPRQATGGPGWSEDALHRWLAEQPWPVGLAGSRGHDAAVLHGLEGRPVTCTDQCIEGVHFETEAEPAVVGAKAVLRCLSDLAATAARPVAVTLAVRAPAAQTDAQLQALISGARAAAAKHGAELVAGDLAQAPGPLGLTVSALGAYERVDVPPGRDRAVAGQGIFLSGPVGGSLAAGRHLAPVPRFDAAARAAHATAMMDVSDGLAWDIFRLLRASGVAGCLELDAVPVHADATNQAGGNWLRALDAALHDGEDHELLATAGDPLPAPWVQIGEVLEGDGLRLASTDPTLEPLVGPWTRGAGRGWNHGA